MKSIIIVVVQDGTGGIEQSLENLLNELNNLGKYDVDIDKHLGKTVTFDTSKLIIIACGAFDGIRKKKTTYWCGIPIKSGR